MTTIRDIFKSWKEDYDMFKRRHAYMPQERVYAVMRASSSSTREYTKVISMGAYKSYKEAEKAMRYLCPLVYEPDEPDGYFCTEWDRTDKQLEQFHLLGKVQPDVTNRMRVFLEDDYGTYTAYALWVEPIGIYN